MKPSNLMVITLLLLTTQTTFSQSSMSAIWDDYLGVEYIRKIGTFPHIENKMPLNVMAAYIVADTLCKTYDRREADSIASSLSPDSIEIAFNTLIAVQNYNLLLYRLLLDHTSHFSVPGYQNNYLNLVRSIEENYYSRVNSRNSYDSLRETATGGIYYVKVLDVSHWIDTITCQPIIDSCDHYTANLQVITSVYGYGNSPWTCHTGSEETPIPCKKVSWQRYPLSHTHGGASDEEYYNQSPGLLVEGQEYIIAIKSWGVGMKPDGTFINEEYPWLVVPVVNDVVLDEYNYFGLGDHANKYELIETLHNGINHY